MRRLAVVIYAGIALASLGLATMQPSMAGELHDAALAWAGVQAAPAATLAAQAPTERSASPRR